MQSGSHLYISKKMGGPKILKLKILIIGTPRTGPRICGNPIWGSSLLQVVLTDRSERALQVVQRSAKEPIKGVGCLLRSLRGCVCMYMSYNLDSSKGGYVRDYIGEYDRGLLRGILGV